jgi:hypothetical protein
MYEFTKEGAQAARKADAGGGAIKEMGKYVGALTQAKNVTTKKGGRGIEFIFKADNGQTAKFAIYTQSATGEQYQGYDALMAIMACMGLRSIKPVDGVALKYDFDQRKDVEEEASIFPELCKPIGVLLETEDYEKQNGSVATRMVLKNVFRAADELTASEILDRKTQPLQLARMVESLRHRPVKNAPAQLYQEQPTRTAPQPAGDGFDDMNDDIPF